MMVQACVEEPAQIVLVAGPGGGVEKQGLEQADHVLGQRSSLPLVQGIEVDGQLAEHGQGHRDEVQRLGRPDPGPSPVGDNQTIALAEDPEEGWEQMAPFFLHETSAYGAWRAQDDIASPYRSVADADELRATGKYRVLTPDQLVAELQAAPLPFAMLHPLCGGMPIDLAWSSLHLLEHEVLPAFA